jgi:hypothetical protein
MFYALFFQATCCSDKLHCCPNGYTCDVAAGTCKKSMSGGLLASLPLVRTQPSQTKWALNDLLTIFIAHTVCIQPSQTKWALVY